MKIIFFYFIICLFKFQKSNGNTFFVKRGPVVLSESHGHLFSKISLKQISQSKHQFLQIADSVRQYLIMINITDSSIHRAINKTIELINNLDEKFQATEKILKMNIAKEEPNDFFLLTEILEQPANPKLSHNIPIKKRNKRQIGIGLAAAAGISLGIYNLYDTTTLRNLIENDMDDQNDINSNILLKLTEDDHKINIINNSIVQFQKQTKKLILQIVRDKNSFNNAIKFVQLLKSLGVKLSFEYNNMLHGLFNLMTGRLTIDLFNLENLEKSYLQLQAKIDQMGFNLADNHFSAIFNSKFSYESDNENIYLFIHIAIIPKQNELFIYQHINLPIFHDDFKIKIQGKSNFLITDSNLDHGIELSTNEVELCQFDKSPIFCPLHYYHRNVDKKCLGLLWSQKHDEAMKVCNVFISTDKEMEIIHIRQNIFAVSANTNDTFILSCPGKEREIVNFTKPQIIRLKPNCKLTGSAIVIEEPRKGPIIEASQILTYPEIPKDIIFDQISPHENEIETMLKPISTKFPKPMSLDILKRKIHKKIRDDKRFKVANYQMLFIAGVVIIIIIIVAIIMVRLIAQFRKS